MKRSILVVVLILWSFGVVAKIPIQGCLFNDKNRNGELDRGEPRLKNIGITNGDTIVWSGGRGEYCIAVDSGGYLIPILPEGYDFATKGAQNGALKFVDGLCGDLDFGLIKVDSKGAIRMAVVGDPQANDSQQMAYVRVGFNELAMREDIDFSMMMGDLVNDKISLLPQFSTYISQLPYRCWSVAGNHDLDRVGGERRTDSYREIIGADVTAFYRGDACFVMLNNVEKGADGMVSNSQLRFLRQIVSHTYRGQLIVLCQHVPMGWVDRRGEILEILKGRNVLILSAHAHTLFRQEWSEAISEVSVGAMCGHWWTGERDYTGIPSALQQCGTPRNYILFDISKGEYKFTIKCFGLDESQQADVWYKNEVDIDQQIEALCKLSERLIVVNIYGGGQTTSLEWSGDGIAWHAMKHTPMVAPTVERMIYMNSNGDYPTKFSRRQPLRRVKSPHTWSVVLPDSLPSETTMLYFRAKDSRGLAPLNFKRIVDL